MWYGSTEDDFEKLEPPPTYEPTPCSNGGVVIKLGTDGYPMSGDEYGCEKCGPKEMDKRLGQFKK